MEKIQQLKRKFYNMGRATVSLITSAILQMAIIFTLQKTGSAMVFVYGFISRFYPMRFWDLPLVC